MWKAILYHFCPGLRPKPTFLDLIKAEMVEEQQALLKALTDSERATHETMMRVARCNRLHAMIVHHEGGESSNPLVAQQPRSDLH